MFCAQASSAKNIGALKAQLNEILYASRSSARQSEQKQLALQREQSQLQAKCVSAEREKQATAVLLAAKTEQLSEVQQERDELRVRPSA